MLNTDDFKALIEDITSEELGDTNQFKIGTIASVEDKARILFDGESTPSGKGYSFLQGYFPEVGDRVLLAKISGTYVIIDKITTSIDKHIGMDDVSEILPNGDGTVRYFRGIKSGVYYLSSNTFPNQPVINGYVHIMKRETGAGINSVIRIYRMSASSPSQTFVATFGASNIDSEVGEFKELAFAENGIVDSGSNSNGSYIRFGDGTQMCWHSESFSGEGTHEYRWIRPVSFSGTHGIFGTTNVTTGSNAAAMAVDVYIRSNGTFIIRQTGYSSAITLFMLAVGRWK